VHHTLVLRDDHRVAHVVIAEKLIRSSTWAWPQHQTFHAFQVFALVISWRCKFRQLSIPSLMSVGPAIRASTVFSLAAAKATTIQSHLFVPVQSCNGHGYNFFRISSHYPISFGCDCILCSKRRDAEVFHVCSHDPPRRVPLSKANLSAPADFIAFDGGVRNEIQLCRCPSMTNVTN